MTRPQIAFIFPRQWRWYYEEELRARLASHDLVDQGTADPSRVLYALALSPPHGLLATFPNLKAIMPVGAGVEHILSDPNLPDVPIIRFVQPDMIQRMNEYILLHVLSHHRGARALREAERKEEWVIAEQPVAGDRTVGILGLGTLGASAAEHLRALGFRVLGWSRTQKNLDGVETYVGLPHLPDFLGQTDILVCLLPLTPATTGLLDRRRLRMLPKGASLINAARGAILVEDDLRAALDADHLSEATLDTFSVEPLPPGHPFWTHPKITVTPHNASAVTKQALADRLVEVIATVEAGGDPHPVVDRRLGY